MARDIDTSKPLSKADVKYLRSRYSDAYVDHLVQLAGSSEGSSGSTEATSADESAQQGDGGAPASPEVPEVESVQEGVTEATEEVAPEATSTETPEGDDGDGDGDGGDDEDLIGVTAENLYDPLAFTTREVRDYLKDATPEEVQRVKGVELARTDREPRTTITNFDPS